MKGRICTVLEQIQKSFELACLLHDVGHAPFSHTGETFYLDKAETLYCNLKDCVGDEAFSKDFDALGTNKPAPHECMSCVVGIRAFPELFKDSGERSLFARCIIGMSIRLQEKCPKATDGMTPEERKEITKEKTA